MKDYVIMCNSRQIILSCVLTRGSRNSSKVFLFTIFQIWLPTPNTEICICTYNKTHCDLAFFACRSPVPLLSAPRLLPDVPPDWGRADVWPLLFPWFLPSLFDRCCCGLPLIFLRMSSLSCETSERVELPDVPVCVLSVCVCVCVYLCCMCVRVWVCVCVCGGVCVVCVFV